ncbi:MAG: hypothetical protein ACJ761_00280 [Chloroflexota bacterium]
MPQRGAEPPPLNGSGTPDELDGTPLDPAELEAIELPERAALSTFTGGLGHAPAIVPAVDPGEVPVQPDTDG